MSYWTKRRQRYKEEMATIAKPKPQSLYEQGFRESMAFQMPQNKGPEWLELLQRAALHRFDNLGFPTRRMELWRHIDLEPVLSRRFTPFEPERQLHPTIEQITPYLLEESKCSRLVFINGAFSPALSNMDALPKGAIASDLTQALRLHEGLVHRFIAKEVLQEPDAFTSLNTALFKNGPFVYVPDNVTLESPIQILFLTQAETQVPRSAYLRGLFVAGKNSRFTLATDFIGLGPEGAPYLNNGVIEIFLEEGASLEHVQVQAEAQNALQFVTTRLFLRSQSYAQLFAVALEGHFTRHLVEAKLLGERARCDINGLAVLSGENRVYGHTEVEHIKSHCSSHQLYKGILEGNTRSEFDGAIVIHSGAAGSDASQLNHNLLLSENAQVFTRPKLRISNDDVKCSHGATVGQLNPEQLFYLASRGLDSATARGVLTAGFAREVIEKIPVSSLRKRLDSLINRKLSVNAPQNEEKTTK